MAADTATGPHQNLREEAALRRVAILAAGEATETEVFSAVTAEASDLLAPAHVQILRAAGREDLDRAVARLVVEAGGPGRATCVPVVVAGETWGGLVAVAASGRPLSTSATARLSDFAQLVASAVAARRAGNELRSLAEQQGALRRVATLVAQGAEREQLFEAIAEEISRILGVKAISLVEYDAATGMLTQKAATHGGRAAVPVGGRWPVDSSPLAAAIVGAGVPARVDDWSGAPGQVAARHRDEGFGQAVAAPLVVGGSIWGYVSAYAEAGETLPRGCEARLADFTHLMATAISNAQVRDELRELAESQGALRRVATLVAQGAEPRAVFTTVALEVSRLLGVGAVSLISYDASRQMFTKIFGTHGDRSPVPDGVTWPVDQCPEGELAIRTGCPARVDDWSSIPGDVAAKHREAGFGQALAAPIIVDGSIWGHMAAYGEAEEILPAGCEDRLADYTNLMASAIANAQARDELRGLAEQQGAALRRVATLVAQQASLSTIFDAVAREARHALDVPRVDVGRRHEDGGVTLLGSTAVSDLRRPDEFSACGRCITAKVIESARAARIDDWSVLPGPDASAAASEGFSSVAGAPIMVDGEIWGVIVVLADKLLPADTETRLTDFTHLVASSISNVHARNSLIASRARIVTASDETRRRIERNLHDGIQQRVVAISLSLRAVRAGSSLPAEAKAGLEKVAADLDSLLEDIRIFSQGLHPALLSRSGIGPALRALGRRSPIPVRVSIAPGPRLSEPVETAIYYVVSEALANAAKHSRAAEVIVTLNLDPGRVHVTIADDGAGGARLAGGSGLIGLVDRVEALGGRFLLESPPSRGTTITIELPLAPEPLAPAADL
jgi:signal transduction histidine kinase